MSDQEEDIDVNQLLANMRKFGAGSEEEEED